MACAEAYIVSGAETGACNGTYNHTGERLGKYAYEIVGGGKWIWWSGAFWYLSNELGAGTQWYYAGGECPDSEDWGLVNGEAPAPTVTEPGEYNHIDGGPVVFTGAGLGRGPLHVTDGGAAVFGGAALGIEAGEASVWTVILFGGGQLVNIFDNTDGGDVVFGGGAVMPPISTYSHTSGGDIIFGGDDVNVIDRGGSTSTSEWDFSRGMRRPS